VMIEVVIVLAVKLRCRDKILIHCSSYL